MLYIGNKRKRITFILSAVFLILLAVFSIIYFFLFSAPQIGSAEERVTFGVSYTGNQIIKELKDQGYIRSEWGFEEALRLKGLTGKIEPGAFMLSKSMNVWQLAYTLANSPYQKWLVVPEGLRKEEVADLLQKNLGLSDEEKRSFLGEAKEGYLFPDTYLLGASSTGKDVADRMMSNFNEKVADSFKQAAEQNIRNDTVVILASLIQREAANDQEMPLIAGIIWNRLEKNMPLQIDSSIQYALGTEPNWWGKITVKDYQINSPYNTYTNKGKPKGPICSPGLAAINAIINPQVSDYLYYLHDASGQIHLAKTYQEQLNNMNQFLK